MNIFKTPIHLRDLQRISKIKPTFTPIASFQLHRPPLHGSIPRNRNMAKINTPIPSLKLNDGTSIPMVSPSGFDI